MWKQVGSQHQTPTGDVSKSRLYHHFYRPGDGIDSNKEELRERKRNELERNQKDAGGGDGGKVGRDELCRMLHITRCKEEVECMVHGAAQDLA